MPDQPPVPEDQIKKIVKQVLSEEQGSSTPPDPEQEKMTQCIIDCTNAHNLAMQTMAYCISKGGPLAKKTLYNGIEDCAEMCDAASKFLLRGSESKSDILKLCQKVCEKCTEACAKFPDDKQLKTCGEFATKAGASCKEVG